MIRHRPERLPLLRPLALALAAASLSCAVVRTQVSAIDPLLSIHDGRADPQIELWVESDRRLSREEEQPYRDALRQALDRGLEGRAWPDDGLLVVRLQALLRSASWRRNQSTVAATDVVLTTVAATVVAVDLAILTAGDVVVVPGELIDSPPPFPPDLSSGHSLRRPARVLPPASPGGAPRLVLAPPPRLRFERRGLEDCDFFLLEVIILDPATGEVRWASWVRRDADPTDPRALDSAVKELLTIGDAGPGRPGRSEVRPDG